MVKLSVIIPIYNDETYLSQCLDSVCNQTLKDIEIICINDGSTDNSLKILNEYAQNDSRITIINQNNQGSAISRNNGLDIAQGEYIGFLDADDIYIDDRGLEMMYDEGIKNDSSVVSANLKFLNSKRKIMPNPHYDRGTFYYFENNCDILTDDYGIPFYFPKNIYRHDLIENIRFPELRRGEDPIFLSEILSKINKIHGVGIDFYGYMVPTTFNKLDTYDKKHDYINQYKQCFEILKESNLTKSLSKYVNNLMMYLKDNVDSELYGIVLDVFNDDMGYFKDYENEYNEYKIANLLNNILEVNTDEYYLEVKKELSDKHLDGELEILRNSKDLSNYKINYFTDKLNTSKNKYEKLLKENEELKKDLESEKRFNENVLNSKSWKLMNKFRKIRGR